MGFWPLAAYLAGVMALFVRFEDPAARRGHRQLVASDADLAMVKRHHAVFYALLMAAPIEWVFRGRPAGAMQILGALLLGAGVAGYLHAGRALGNQLGPLIAPAEPAVLIERGPYGRLRHPMYLAELAMAFGAPALLAASWTFFLSGLFTVLVIQRIGVEERALAERLSDYPAYAARTSRLIPHVY
ncbi:MAG: isoprenylcysteine carboxylmethyltransferase family protein [Candidatus Binatia bacterium]